MARRAEMPVYKEDKSKDLLISLEFKNGHPLIIITMRADDITPEMFDWYQRDICTHATKIDKNNIMKLMETEADGTPIIHQRIITPVMVSNRSIIEAFYEERRPDGSLLFIAGSVGNEEYLKKYSKEIGKDEIAQCILSYCEVTPVKDGTGKATGS
jgi:hypothetical protein